MTMLVKKMSRFINRQFARLFCQAIKSARNILHTNMVYLKASADKLFLRKTIGGIRRWITKWTFKMVTFAYY